MIRVTNVVSEYSGTILLGLMDLNTVSSSPVYSMADALLRIAFMMFQSSPFHWIAPDQPKRLSVVMCVPVVFAREQTEGQESINS